jgi:DNA end-binding protein Ku
MTRAIFKAELVLGRSKLPVKLYSAVQERAVHFRMLHDKDRVPVKQRMVNASTGEVVSAADVQMASEVEGNRFVLLDDDELAALEPEESRQIVITRFVPPAQINPQWYERPYYVGPDGRNEGYFALAAALAKRDVVGIATWVMRRKRYVGALRVHADYLVLVALRFADQVVMLPAVKPPESSRPKEGERKLAAQLIGTLEGHFDAAEFHDDYRERLLELIQAKARGARPKLRKARARRATGSLSDSLKRSIATAQEKRVA